MIRERFRGYFRMFLGIVGFCHPDKIQDIEVLFDSVCLSVVGYSCIR